MVSLRTEFTGFQRQFRDYVNGVRADSGKAALLASKIYARQLVGMTPPGDGAQAGTATLTKADQRRGEGAVLRDLNTLFVGVRLKGRRKEMWPDVAGIHREAFIRVRGSSGRKFPSGTKPKYVDLRKLNALRRTLFAAIGGLAAKWGRAAALVGVAVPAWVNRHGAGGQGSLTLRANHFRFEAINPGVPPFLMADMVRREQYAERNTGNALQRSLEAILQKRAARFNRRAA